MSGSCPFTRAELQKIVTFCKDRHQEARARRFRSFEYNGSAKAGEMAQLEMESWDGAFAVFNELLVASAPDEVPR